MKQVIKIFIVSIFAVTCIFLASKLLAKEPDSKHRIGLSVGAGIVPTSTLNTGTIYKGVEWVMRPSAFYSGGVSYRLHRNIEASGVLSSYYWNATAKQGRYIRSEWAWKSYTAAFRVNYVTHIGDGGVYAGPSIAYIKTADRGDKMNFTDRGEGTEYGAHIGFFIPVVEKKLWFWVEGNAVTSSMKASLTISHIRYTTTAAPVSAGLRFKL